MSSLFAFRSCRTRLLVFLLALRLPVLLGIYVLVNRENTDYTDDIIENYLQCGSDIFELNRKNHKNTLLAITSTMTCDWSFRNAFGTGEHFTITDAADMMLIASMEGEVIIDTGMQGFEKLEGEWPALMDAAAAYSDGIGCAIITVQGVPYQITVIPLFVPTPVAWIFGGFALNNRFAATVKQSVVSDVSIVEFTQDASGQALPEVHVIASTLSDENQQLLGAQLQQTGTALTDPLRIALSDGEYGTLLRPLYGQPGDSLQIVAVIQKSYNENMENLQAFQNVLLQFYLAVIAISLIALILLARSVTRPIFALARRVRRIEAGDYGQGLAVTGQDEIGQLAGSINRMAAGLAEKEKVCSLLGKVVSHEIAEESLSKTIALVGEERVVTVLFADIKGFTSLCENLAPKAVLPLLNRYLSEITEVIERHHGVVDKYTGDSVMALFGAPLSRPGDAGNAIATALAIQSTIAALNTKNLAQGMFAIEAGIGVHTGLVVAGNLGSQNRLNYTVIGDSVNLSARLEGLTRRYHVPNIVSEATRRDAPGFVYRELDLVRVAGKKEPVRIFEVLGREGEVSAQVLDEADALARVLQDNRAQRWQQALQGLQALLTAQPAMAREASLYRVCAARIAALREETLPPDWDAVHSF